MTTSRTFAWYRRLGKCYARPYQPGEDLTGISVSAQDTPEEGGMIAQNPKDASDQWYINLGYFAENFELDNE